jgi:hypothetical protein
MNGGKGSHGNLPELVENRDFISVGMPIFVKDDAKPEGRYIVADRDAPNLWKQHREMLERLHSLIPNINRKLGLAAGFSNGANSIRCLVELTDGVYQTYFNRYIFCEGGTLLYDAGNLNGPTLGVAGDRAMGIPNRPGNVRDTVVNPALARGVDAEYILMKDTRHEFSKAYHPHVRDWINRKVLRGGLEKNLKELRDSADREDWPKALGAYRNVVLLTGDSQSERRTADDVLQIINVAGVKAWAKLTNEPPVAEAVASFVDEWSPCVIVKAAVETGNPMGQAMLEKIRQRKGRERWRELGAFLNTWKKFPVATAARRELAREGIAVQEKVADMPEGDEKIRAWNKLKARYPATKPAAHAYEQLEVAWKAENLAAFQMTDKLAKTKRLKEMMRLFAGTRHENAAKKRYAWTAEPKKEWRPWILERNARRAKKKQEAE